MLHRILYGKKLITGGVIMQWNWEKFDEKSKEEEKFKEADYKGLWIPREGDSFIMILPPKKDGDLPWHLTYQHYLGNKKSLPSEIPSSIMCTLKTPGSIDKKCAVCEYVSSMYPSDKKLGDKIRAKLRYYMNVVVIKDADGKPHAEAPKIMSFGISIFTQIQDFFKGYLDPETNKQVRKNLCDMKIGYRLRIKRKGNDLNTTYKIELLENNKPLEKSILDLMLAKMQDLAEVDIKYTYQEQGDLIQSICDFKAPEKELNLEEEEDMPL